MKKPTNPPNPSPEFDRNREFGVILERIHSHINIIVEDTKSLKDRVNVMSEELGRQREDISLMKVDIRFIKEDIRFMKADLADVKVTLGVNDGRLSRLENAVLK